MPSLASCIKKAGKALDGADAASIREIHDDYVGDGLKSSEAAMQAIEDYLGILDQEFSEATDQARQQGADVGNVTNEMRYFAPAREELVDPGPVRMRLDDEVEQFIDEHPDNPLAATNKLAVTMEDQANYGPTTVQAAVDWARGKGIPAIKTALKFIPTKYIPDFLPGKLPAAVRITQLIDEQGGRSDALIARFHPKVKSLAKYINRNDKNGKVLGELMPASTLAGVDPSEKFASLKPRENMTDDDKAVDAKRRADHKLLSRFYASLDPEGQQLFREVRDSYKALNDIGFQALLNRIQSTEADPEQKTKAMDLLRKRFEAGRVAGPYFPLSRFGNFWAAAKDAATGETVAYAKFESIGQMRSWIHEMDQAGFQTQRGQKGDTAMDTVNAVDPGFVTQVTNLTKGIDPNIADQIWQLYLQTLPEMSARKSFMHRKGRAGFSSDVARAFSHRMFHGAMQTARLENQHLFEKAFRDLADQVDGYQNSKETDWHWAVPIRDEMKNRWEFSKNPTGNAITSTLTGVGFFAFLGFTPMAAAVNMSQTPIFAFPTIGARFNHFGAAKELARASSEIANIRGSLADKLRGDERQAFLDLDEHYNTFNRTQAHDLAAMSEGMDPTGKFMRAMEISSFLFHHAERINREVTAIATYRLSRTAGRTHDAAVEEAHELTMKSHFDYSNENRPAIMQNQYSKVFFLFKNYSINALYRIMRDARDGFLKNKNLSPEEKSEARQRLGGIIGMTALFTGATGMPGYWIAQLVYDSLFDDEDDPHDLDTDTRVFLRDTVGDKMAQTIMNGPVDAFGKFTTSTRVSLNNLMWREAPYGLDAMEKVLFYTGEAAGPLLRLVSDPLVMAEKVEQGYGDRAWERTPIKVIKDQLKAWRLGKEGLTDKNNNVIVPSEEFTNWEVFMQSMGAVPGQVTWQYEVNRQKFERAARRRDRRQLLMNRWAIAKNMGDDREVEDAMAEITRWNETNPRMAITPKNRLQSLRGRKRRQILTKEGVYLERRQRQLHEDLGREPPKEK